MSWVQSAKGSDFPIENLPLGIFSEARGQRRPGVAIGDYVLDLAGISDLLEIEWRDHLSQPVLNSWLACGPESQRELRLRLGELLSDERYRDDVEPHLIGQSEVRLHVPCLVGDYSDFYVGIHHATNVGKQFRPDNPLLPNYKYVPIGYHGRASSVRVSGEPVIRPSGQRKAPDADAPEYGPSRRLDYELELGIWVGRGNDLGSPIPIHEAGKHIAGFCLLNDWSARDLQAWEYQPLGPFLSKNFGSIVSPWVITPEALAPFRTAQPPRPEGDPTPLPYLSDETDEREGGLDLTLEVLLLTPGLKEKGLGPHRLSLSSTRHMYWTVAQMVAHHTCNGCNLRPGDLLGSGTISAPDEAGCGSLLETTQGGKRPVRLQSGEERRFLEDGDEVLLRARARRDGYVDIGFGECRGVVVPVVA